MKIFIILMSMFNLLSREALVIKPIIDLIPQKMSSIYQDIHYYNFMPLSPVAKFGNLTTCPRVHQLLFNEIVQINKLNDQEVIVQLPEIYYQTIDNDKKNNTFWTLKDNLIYLKNLDLTKLPTNENNKIATLIFPFEDEVTNQIYSAGTKFIYKELDNNSQEYIVYIFDPKEFVFKESKIPKKFCITKEYLNELSKQKKIVNFVNILKKWANLKHGFIPYVWGGCSFSNTINEKNFEAIEKKYENKKINYFSYKSYSDNPKSGFDCSGLILMAAQLSQIPFYFKNTTTILKNLEALDKDKPIIEGDLIWIPGHIIIISNLKYNLCVEARGYLNNGAGKVHEIELNRLFKNMNTFTNLKDAFFNKKKLERLDMQGNVFEVHPNFKILKIESCWK